MSNWFSDTNSQQQTKHSFPDDMDWRSILIHSLFEMVKFTGELGVKSPSTVKPGCRVLFGAPSLADLELILGITSRRDIYKILAVFQSQTPQMVMYREGGRFGCSSVGPRG